MFNEGKRPIEVAIELDIETDYLFSIYQKFLRLTNHERFISAYEHVKGNIGPYLQLYDLMNSLGMSPDQVFEQVKYGNILPYLASHHSTLSGEVKALESQKQTLHLLVNFMRNRVEEFNHSIQYYDFECQRRANEILYMDSEITTRKNFIQNLDNDEGYTRIKEAAKKETKLIMQDFCTTSAVTLSATVEAIMRYPDIQMLIFDISSFQKNPTIPNEEPWVDSHMPQLLQLVQNVQNEIIEKIANAVVSNAKSTQQDAYS